MATVVTVHGTFAHTGGTADALSIGDNPELQWWQTGSTFDTHLHGLTNGADGKLDVVPFVWSAWNSETERRKAGNGLLKVLHDLEKKGESYCLVGHSHGGSVIAAALLESTAKGKPLAGLKKWITVGTPFVDMKKEKLLFSRLTLTRKVMFVSSAMLLMMFLFYAVGEIFSGAPNFHNQNYLPRLMFSAAMMSIPFLIFYTALKILDGRALFSYGRKAMGIVRENYAPKWLPLFHKDDEAVEGLKYLRKVNLSFFERDFAVSSLTMVSILILPLAYLLVVTSPTIMVGIANFLKNSVYDVDHYKNVESTITAARDDLRRTMGEMRKARDDSENNGLSPATAESARRRADDLRNQLREKRRNFETSHPEYAEVERATRFKRRFLERNDVPCEGDILCGQGHDYALNSKLLFHVVTDELASAVVNDDWQLGAFGIALRLLVPIILVPFVFGLLALGILAVIEVLARYVSALLSRGLNRLTLSELKRSAFGNDTDGEIALGVDNRPSWIKSGFTCLPNDIGDKITDQCNTMTVQSLVKFRNAISTLAFAEGTDNKAGMISSYLSWKELIHTTYFDVPEFRKIVACAIGNSEGFVVLDGFKRDPDYDKAMRWLAEMTPKPEPDPNAPAPAAQAVPFPT